MTINDGNGLWDKYGMIGNIKKLFDAIADSRGWARCVLITEAVKMLESLESGLKKEDAANAELVADLKSALKDKIRELGGTVEDVPIEEFKG